MLTAPGRHEDDHVYVHWNYVGGRAPWRHAPDWQPSAEPAPAEPDRIAALEQRMAELEAMVRTDVEVLRTATATALQLLRSQP